MLHCLSDRLQDDEDSVREEAMTCLKKVAPLFPSGCEEILRRSSGTAGRITGEMPSGIETSVQRVA